MAFFKKLVLILVLISLPSIAFSAKKKEPTTIDVIRQIESNLIYNQDVSSMSSQSGVDIDRGWDAERYKYGAEQISAEIKPVTKEEKIIELERKAYEAFQKGQREGHLLRSNQKGIQQYTGHRICTLSNFLNR